MSLGENWCWSLLGLKAFGLKLEQYSYFLQICSDLFTLNCEDAGSYLEVFTRTACALEEVTDVTHKETVSKAPCQSQVAQNGRN